MTRTSQIVLAAILALSTAFPTSSSAEDNSGIAGRFALFVMTNSPEENEVISFVPSGNGLERQRAFKTGGRGSGGVTDPLESQGSLTLSQGREFLFAVNAGSGDVTVFRVNGPELSRIDRVPSGGSGPNAIAQRGDLVFVLNAGAGSNVTGFRLAANGKLIRIAHSTAFLTINNPRAGSLAFSADGQFLLVTEKATNRFDAFQIHADGTLGPVVVTPSVGPGLFAVVFAPNGAAIATETGAGGGGNTSAISSYAVAANGQLTPLSTSVPTHGAATCWQVVTPDGRFVYTSNSASATISGFAIGANGTLDPLPGTVVAILTPGATNLDMAISSDGRFLYTLNSGAGSVSIFRIEQDGSLTSLGDSTGLDVRAGINGIAAL